jgi:pimeloyl-ACP methyl ester carboxylesterase
MIATTSFRRNGAIISDAIADLDALREHIVKTYGTPDRVLLEGESMGGLIVTLMAEREPDFVSATPRLYDGAVAIGAALEMREDNMTVGLTLQPKIPLLFLTNQSELDGPRHYVMPKTLPDNAGVRPVLFRVSRNGHINVSPRERVAALRTVNDWIDGGRETLPKPEEGQLFFDATQPLEWPASLVMLHADHRGFDARVMEINGLYGNVAINAQPDDFAAAGIKLFMWLQLKTGDQTQRIRYARDFDSVKRGEWVVFPFADGYCWIANFENAAATAGLKVGDTVTLQLFDDPSAP